MTILELTRPRIGIIALSRRHVSPHVPQTLEQAYRLCVEDGVQMTFGDCAAAIDWLQYELSTAVELACH